MKTDCKRLKVNRIKQWSVVSMIIVLSMLLSACSKEVPAVLEENGASIDVVDKTVWFPAMWVVGNARDYQPTFGTKTRKNDFENNNGSLYLTMNGIMFALDMEGIERVQYKITDQDREIEQGMILSEFDENDERSFFNFTTRTELEDKKEYGLEISVEKGGQTGYYYFGLYYSDLEINTYLADQSLSVIKEELAADNIVIVEAARLWIDGVSNTEASVTVEFLGAKREEDGFSYEDYHYELLVNPDENTFNIEGTRIKSNQRYYYDAEYGYVLGNEKITGTLDDDYIDSVSMQVLEKADYQLIYNEFEAVLYNKKTETLEKVFRKDKFDSEYVYDEIMEHKLVPVELSDDGSVYFISYGGPLQREGQEQKNGIRFLKYHDGMINELAFYEMNDNIEMMEAFYRSHSYYNSDAGMMWFVFEQSLFELNFLTGDFQYVESLLKAEYYDEYGVFVWQGDEGKYNSSIYIANLNAFNLEIKNLYKTGEYARLLTVENGFLCIGKYDVEDTYEHLDGSVDYYYKRLEVYNLEGDIIKVITPYNNQLVNGMYDEDGKYYYDVLKQVTSGSGKNLRIDYQLSKKVLIEFSNLELSMMSKGKEVADSEIYQLANEVVDSYDDKDSKALGEVENEGTSAIKTLPKEEDIIFLKDSIYMDGGRSLSFDYTLNDVYVVEYGGSKSYYTYSFIEALTFQQTVKEGKIYYLDGNINGDELIKTLMYDQESLSGFAYLDEVINIPQRPELPRGCEVTSLAILLDYYMEDAPDKMELADGLKSSTVEYKVLDGVIHYADMHTEFAGSMDDGSLPGLGVYTAPVAELAKDYISGDEVVNGVFDLSGMSFEQMMTFVSMGKPVLVIVPNRYHAVPNYALEVWKTPNGFMEVTYQEHSVVVIGFDSDYVYYSDPSKGIIDKKNYSEFKAAWESIGNQGIVIYE